MRVLALYFLVFGLVNDPLLYHSLLGSAKQPHHRSPSLFRLGYLIDVVNSFIPRTLVRNALTDHQLSFPLYFCI